MLKTIKHTLLFGAFAFLTGRTVNLMFRVLLKPLLPVLPSVIPNKFPVVGSISVDLPDTGALVLQTDGRDTIASRLYWKGIQGHEPETIDTFLRLLPSSAVVFDVGASTGLFALIAAARGKEIEVHAFEAVPETYKFMVLNVSANRLTNIKPVQACVTDHDGEETIYLNSSPALPLTSSTQKGYRRASRSVVVPAITLDTYARNNDIEKVDLIKIDAEGSDDKVLEGARWILEQHKPTIICEVLYDHTDKLIQAILNGTGYQYYFIQEAGLAPTDNIVGDSEWKLRNYLFVHKDRLPELLGERTLGRPGGIGQFTLC